METSVKFEDLTKEFEDVVAVDHLNLKIEKGEFFALLGPSGCGKTTTLRLIAGLEQPTEGKIFLNNEDVSSYPPKERDVAMVFQDYALYPHMTISENIGYPLKVRGVAKEDRQERIKEAAENLQIGELLDRRPSQLSGGQQQRVSVARALVHEPSVFLFDEPLSNLDARLRIEARTFLRHLQKELGITTIYVTHDQSEALALADRIAIMEAGQARQVDAAQKVYHEPADTFVANFVGSPPMNLLQCRVNMEGETPILETENNTISFTNLENRLQRLKERDELILGIRPEDMDLTLNVDQDEQLTGLVGEIYAVETLGAQVLFSVKIGNSMIRVREMSSEKVSQLAVGDDVSVEINEDRVLYYDAEDKALIN
ncbi:ABC transporter ATP-binding protein [Candidatus Bipolaricaulota bacterium]|nr:ABC transporter ATP-binding protein [Candidatus Bipolaricaulota bacterium]